MNNQPVLKTCLYDNHTALDAKMVPFANYIMPISYKNGLQHEYSAVRNRVGMFDVSHMGQIYINGKDSINFLQYTTVNNIRKMSVGATQYNLICNQDAGIIDDVIIYMLDINEFLLVVNASNIKTDYDWFLKQTKSFDVTITNNSDFYSIIAVQGPKSRKILTHIFSKEIDLKFYMFENIKIFNSNLLVSGTGYTGELGYEVIGSHILIQKIWELLLDNSVVPCGLASRDILRMEMKYCLYGNDISIETNPIEAGLGWVVDFSKKKYIGKEVIDKLREL